MITKKCKVYPTPEGEPNPSCLGEFKCHEYHASRRHYCATCMTLKKNAYMRAFGKKKRAEARRLKIKQLMRNNNDYN